jgi:adenosylcobinamide-GDP ribazoletransferase
MSVLGVFIVALPIFLTGGIHFDGLLDTCDGLFSGRSRERILEIMRDSRVGSMGVIAGILNILLRYSIIIELPEAILPMLLIAQAATGRWVMAIALHFFPYARKDGGLGQGFTEKKKNLNVALSSLFALIILLLSNGIAGILIALTAASICLLIACWVVREIGGLTGDVYGALNEVAENLFLLLWLVGSITFHLQP